jgi:uncharacterized membrane protein YeaQ/YmgE (transglycosylase-associated protein family)
VATVLSLHVAAEAILPASDSGGYVVSTIMVLVGAVLGGCIGLVLFGAGPIDDL